MPCVGPHGYEIVWKVKVKTKFPAKQSQLLQCVAVPLLL